MRYSEMQAFEKERTARRARGGSSSPPDLGAAPLRVPWWLFALLGIGLLLLTACSSPVYRDTSVPMTTNGPVDLARYEGLWYEIARFPNSFEEGCVGVTAEYAQNADGTIKVVNTCRQGTLDGPVEVAEGVATVENADVDKLKVGFVRWLPFARGDYWILFTDYEVAVIGTPSGGVGWVLARAPTLPEARLGQAMAVLERNGYDLKQLTLTPQRPE